MDARKALHELREYFEQKRNLALRELGDGSARDAACYNHAMEMVAEYIRMLPTKT